MLNTPCMHWRAHAFGCVTVIILVALPVCKRADLQARAREGCAYVAVEARLHGRAEVGGGI